MARPASTPTGPKAGASCRSTRCRPLRPSRTRRRRLRGTGPSAPARGLDGTRHQDRLPWQAGPQASAVRFTDARLTGNAITMHDGKTEVKAVTAPHASCMPPASGTPAPRSSAPSNARSIQSSAPTFGQAVVERHPGTVRIIPGDEPAEPQRARGPLLATGRDRRRPDRAPGHRHGPDRPATARTGTRRRPLRGEGPHRRHAARSGSRRDAAQAGRTFRNGHAAASMSTGSGRPPGGPMGKGGSGS